MKTRIFIISFFFLIQSIIYSQNIKPQILLGSWMGKLATDQFSLRALLKFEMNSDTLKGAFDSPDQGFKDLPLDRIWTVNDSVYVDASKSLHAGIIFKGKMLPGDSVIDGIWGGALGLRLSRTDFVFTLKTNLNPEIEGYKVIKLIQTSPIKDQQATGICWTFATTSFIETEALRLGKDPVFLSPLFYVAPTYIDKGEKYIRMNGKSSFGPGDLTFSVLKYYEKYGAVPQLVWSGKKDSTAKYDHGKMDKALLDKVKYYVNSGRGKMTTEEYRNEIDKILTQTMGRAPETFMYHLKQYTPVTFAREMVGINPGNYVEITSFSHHPFYSKFILEIESNWNNNYYLNLPLNDFSSVIDYALTHNYSVCWDGDAYRDPGFNDGFAVLNDTVNSITQLKRQTDFDNYSTIDQHNMHIVGIAESSKGKRFYIIKNSSDAKNCGGYIYMSKEYLLLKTISVMVHKDAVPQEIKNKLGFVL